MEQSLTPYEALQVAAEKAGGQTALARICGGSQPTVWKWLQSSKRLPGDYVLQVEAATGVPRYYLRPDIYPINLPPAPARWYGIDRHAGTRSFGLDRRINGVALDRSAKSKGASL